MISKECPDQKRAVWRRKEPVLALEPASSSSQVEKEISPKNSKWLAENVEEVGCRVKEMLKLIQEEGDSFAKNDEEGDYSSLAKKAEMFYQKRPELISHVEDLYNMYLNLADRYGDVSSARERSLEVKHHLEAVIRKHEHDIEELRAAIGSVSEEKAQLVARVSEQEDVIEGLRVEGSRRRADLSRTRQRGTLLKARVRGLHRGVASRNSRLSGMQEAANLAIAELIAERNGLGAWVVALTQDVICRDNWLSWMEERHSQQQQLHSDHVSHRIVSDTELASLDPLRERVKELEEVVERQTALISDAAEGLAGALSELMPIAG